MMPPSQRPPSSARAWYTLLAISIAILGFAIFPACFYPTARDGLHDGDRQRGSVWNQASVSVRGDERSRAVAALTSRGWTIDIQSADKPPPPSPRDFPEKHLRREAGEGLATADGASVSAHAWRNHATISWSTMGATGIVWSASVQLRDDPASGQPMKPWPNQPWEEMRLLHLVVGGAQPMPTWRAWPLGTPVSLHQASAHHWDPYTVWDPARVPPPYPAAAAQARP